jgi:type III secretory pathway component EscV
MKENKFIFFSGIILIVAILAAPIIFLRLNNPALLLDIIISAYYLTVLAVFILSLSAKRIRKIYFFPKLFFMTSCIGLVISIVFLLVFSNDTTYLNYYLINFFSFLFSKLKIESLVGSLVILMYIFIIYELIFSRNFKKLAEETNNIALDEFPQKKMIIEKDYLDGTISDEEASAKMKQLNWEIELLDYIVKVNHFISICFIIFLSFVIIIVLINIIIFIIQKLLLPVSIDEFSYDEIISFSSLALGSFTLTLFPVFLLSIISRIIIFQINKKNKDNNKEMRHIIKWHSVSYTIEIGCGLSSLISQANLTLIINQIKSSIPSSDKINKFIIPMINDSLLMEKFEYRIYINDIIMHRGFIEVKEEEKMESETVILKAALVIANQFLEVLSKYEEYKYRVVNW